MSYHDRTRQSALNDLVEKIMSGKSYDPINLSSILEEADPTRLHDAIHQAICGEGLEPSERHALIQDAIEEMVTDFLEDSQWHDMRQREREIEAEEAARESWAEHRHQEMRDSIMEGI
jgi:hypothetical protein